MSRLQVTVTTKGIPPPVPANYTQYLRKVGLIVSKGTQGFDLSNLRIIFRVQQFDESIPNTATIRVFNLSDATALRVQKEFQTVTLQAGYEGGNYGIIFQGTIKQFKKGRIDALTSYLEIFASDGDQAYNFALINQNLRAGSTFNDRAAALQKQAAQYFEDKTIAQIPLSAGTGGLALPRGKVLFGLFANQMDVIARSTLTTWNIVNGGVKITDQSTYAPGTAVELNVSTGLVGVPEATDNGIEVTCLLNPAIRIGQRVHINNRAINTTSLTQAGQNVLPLLPFPATVTNDGFYSVIVANHEGDSRGGPEWFSRLTCLALSDQNGQVTTGG